MKKRQTAAGDYEQIKSWIPDPQWELYKAVLTASLTARAYHPENISWMSIRNMIRQNDPVFAGNLILWLRQQKQWRDISFVLLAEMAVLYRNNALVGRLTEKVVHHAGEIPVFLHYYRLAGDHSKLSSKPDKQLVKGLTAVFNRLDEFQYTRFDKDIQTGVKAALTYIRPRPGSRAQRVLYGKIIRDRLGSRKSWEQEYREFQALEFESPELKQAAAKDKWKEWISGFRPGYPALLGNLPAVLSAGVSGKVLKLAAEYLGNANAVSRERQSPYTILEAYKQLKLQDQGGAVLLMDALEDAAIHSAHTLTGFKKQDRFVIAMDVSNSMSQPVREGSLVQRFDVAPLLASLLRISGYPVRAGIVGNTWKWIDLPGRRPLAALAEFHAREDEAGYGTNGYLVIKDLLNRRVVTDRVMIFADSQLWYNRPFNQAAGTDLRSLWRQYREIAPQARIVLFDLSGQDTIRLEIPEENVFLVSGWHEKIFEVLQAVENSGEILELINDINQIG